jgi:hypothetical protein
MPPTIVMMLVTIPAINDAAGHKAQREHQEDKAHDTSCANNQTQKTQETME